MSNGCFAMGRIINDDLCPLEASSGLDEYGNVSTHKSGRGCYSVANAKRNVVKRLANMLRSERDGSDFIYWDKLSSKERKQWIREVTARLVWVEVSAENARLSQISATEFIQAFNREVA